MFTYFLPLFLHNCCNTTRGCKQCAIDTKQRETNATKCDACPVGWSSEKGSTKCQSCEAGTFSNKIGMDCANCDAGQYRQSKETDDITQFTDPTKCVGCPAGWSSEKGSTKCQSCEAGTFSNKIGMDCANCDIGQYRQRKKADGTTSTDPTKCVDCPTGWTSLVGSSKCQLCGAGTFGAGCQSCPLGYARKGDDVDATQCRHCDIGQTTTEKGSATCQGCDLGEYGHKKGECSVCPMGQYQDGKGETACKECDVDTYLNELGKSSKADCRSCDADRSTAGIKGAVDNSSCICKKDQYYQVNEVATGWSTCEECPDGGDCSAKDGLTLIEITARPGRWRPDATSLIFSPCKVAFAGTTEERNKMAEARCCPLHLTSNEIGNATESESICTLLTNMTHSDEQCLEGYGGALCLVCAQGYVKQGDACFPCPAGASIVHAFIALGIFCLPVFVLVLIVLACSFKEEKAEKGSKVIGKLKIIVAYIQILGSLPGVMDSVAWPDIFVSFTVPLLAINIDVMSMFANSACSMAILFPKQFIVHMSMPPMIILSAYMAYLCSNFCGKKVAKKQRSAQAFKIILVVTNFLYPGLCTRIFQMFKVRTFFDIPILTRISMDSSFL